MSFRLLDVGWAKRNVSILRKTQYLLRNGIRRWTVSLAAIRGKYFTAVATQGLLALLGAYLEQRTTGQADDLRTFA